MIYTVTFNPSLDYVIQIDDFKDDGINRTKKENVYPGGKGNNVAVVCATLGEKSRALGFKSGFTGDAMETMLRQYGCDTDFIQLEEGLTRINVKVKAEDEFEINGQGPIVPSEKIEELYKKLDEIGEGDVLALSGSIPASMPGDIYEKILAYLSSKDVIISVDATNDLLMNVLKYNPFLIKPNNHELEEMFGVNLTDDKDIVFYAKKLQEMGARNVLVSMAGDGAILVTENGEDMKLLPPKGEVVNSVGAGDSMVAGFLVGYLKTKDYEYALRLGTAAGSATAFTGWLAKAEEIEALL